MYLVTVGLNHKAAPVEVRECLAFTATTLPLAMLRLSEQLQENTILSTCNRMEVYGLAENPHLGYGTIRSFLASFHGVEESAFSDYLYMYSQDASVRHLFSVSSGIDSMILGEPQILGQVVTAYELAVETGVTDRVLTTLFRQAISVGKRARTETAISQNAMSISYVAVELAKQIFGEISRQMVLLIGAGEMAEGAAKTLVDCGAKGIMIANRTLTRAQELADRMGGSAVPFESLDQALKEADIVISSTGAQDAVIGPELMKRVMKARHNRPIFLIDIAVPRDVDPAVQKLDNVFLYDIDDLQGVIATNQREREREVAKVNGIIEEEITKYMAWFRSLDVVPLIVALRERAEAIRTAELDKISSQLNNLSDKERNALNSLTHAIVNKILHEPTIRLKQYSDSGKGHVYGEVVRTLFGLEEDPAEKKVR